MVDMNHPANVFQQFCVRLTFSVYWERRMVGGAKEASGAKGGVAVGAKGGVAVGAEYNQGRQCTVASVMMRKVPVGFLSYRISGCRPAIARYSESWIHVLTLFESTVRNSNLCAKPAPRGRTTKMKNHGLSRLLVALYLYRATAVARGCAPVLARGTKSGTARAGCRCHSNPTIIVQSPSSHTTSMLPWVRGGGGKSSSSSAATAAAASPFLQGRHRRKACSFYIWDAPSAILSTWCHRLQRDCVYEGLGGKKVPFKTVC